MQIEKEEIEKIKNKENVVILAHNYQIPEIQDIADFVADSLELAKYASKVTKDIIIFCGVDFMVENTVILNPDKTVIHPDTDAKCPMAAMVNIEKLKNLIEEHPDAGVVSYVNTNAETKSLSDICCTSANAVNVVKSLPNKEIIFLPDRNLAYYVQSKVPDRKIIPWDGYCYVHQDTIEKDILLMLKKEYPNAEIIVHPECLPEVIEISDKVFSTQGMVKYVSSSEHDEFIIGTERELCYRLRKQNPTKKIYSLDNAICRPMKKITIDKLVHSLKNLEPKVILSEEIIESAKKPIQKMIAVPRDD